MARAAGFSIFEQGARGMGFAGAFTAVANDPSAIFHNAGGVGVPEGQEPLPRAAPSSSPSFDFAGDDPFPGAGVAETSDSSRLDIAIPAVYYTHQFSETRGLRAGRAHALRPAARSGPTPTSSPAASSPSAPTSRRSPSTPPWASSSPTGSAWGWASTSGWPRWSSHRNVPAINPFTQQVADIAAGAPRHERLELGLRLQPGRARPAHATPGRSVSPTATRSRWTSRAPPSSTRSPRATASSTPW